MRKLTAMFIIALFVLSIVPLSFADSNAEVNSEAEVESGSLGIRTALTTSAKINAGFKDNATDHREDARDRLKDMEEKNRERLAKIAALDQRQIERLLVLDVKNVEKIAELKGERLQKLSELSEEKLKRIAELDKEKLEKIAELNQSDMEKLASLNRARFNELAKLDKEKIMADLKSINVVKVKNANELYRKNVTRAELLQFRERFEKAKDNFEKYKSELEDAREALKQAKERSDENATLEHAKNYVVNTANALANHLEKVKAKVQENKNIPEDKEAIIVAEIDAQIADIAKIRAEAEAAATKEQIKEAAKKLRAKWSTLQHLIKLYSEKVVSARVEGIVHQGLVLEKKLDNILQKAKDRNITINITAEIELFSAKIEDSRENYKLAQAKLSEALELRAEGEPADSQKIKALVEESNQLLKESRDSIKEAYDVLKTIVKKIKGAYPEADLSADVEVEVEED